MSPNDQGAPCCVVYPYFFMTSKHVFFILPTIIWVAFSQAQNFKTSSIMYRPITTVLDWPTYEGHPASSLLRTLWTCDLPFHRPPLANLLENLRSARVARMPPLERSRWCCTHSPSDRSMLCVLCSNVGVTQIMPYARLVDVCVCSAVDPPYETPHTLDR